MNTNQQKAAELARSIVAGRLSDTEVPDTDWALLLMAAELCDSVAPPLSVATRVLDRVAHQQGYFACEQM